MLPRTSAPLNGKSTKRNPPFTHKEKAGYALQVTGFSALLNYRL
jgi:hypothetical protein